MSQSLTKLYIHIIFSTKNRENILREENLFEIHNYIRGIIQQNLCKSITIGGTSNHIHILCEMGSTISTAMLTRVQKKFL
ncbi:transposase [Bacteroides sp.]|uniref:transposase n=1 Tax=Bacteroides sp. TaxID=29523 RepID=UPI0026276CE6|nr:transposase [Bacteroides sp.]